ncbi:helix-turn-helix transcriptional regulator [Microbacterium sp. CFH 90308]|uniref:Helix-turn-helix transcriptional regulator n=1 Tax=Microbacterium salsuginis TaxID=2722803 RepID=A0ABX1KE06_9MICO|nr:helix-turn-helix transcriptional regulator [Microbacterium sp. CFH 90308]
MSKIRHRPAAPTERRNVAPRQTTDVHTHDDHQILFADSGVLEVITDVGTWFAPATRAIWIPAGTAHSWRAHGRLTVHMLGLPLSDNPLHLDSPAVLAVSPLLRELLRERTADATASTPESRRLHAVLLDQLRGSPLEPIRLPSPADETLARVCRAMHADPSDSRSLAELAADVSVSERTLSRRFRSQLGMTFPQWRTQLRLFHALKMLASGASVTATAHACGWSSTSAFIDVFRRAFGVTPGAHRRE